MNRFITLCNSCFFCPLIYGAKTFVSILFLRGMITVHAGMGIWRKDRIDVRFFLLFSLFFIWVRLQPSLLWATAFLSMGLGYTWRFVWKGFIIPHGRFFIIVVGHLLGAGPKVN